MRLQVKHKKLFKLIAGIVLAAVSVTSFSYYIISPSQADIYANVFTLTSPNQLLEFSPKISKKPYDLPVIRGLKIDLNNPYNLEFYFDTMNKRSISNQETNRLIKYFLGFLTIPQENLWVNLSPYESNKIIPNSLEQLDIGKDFLIQDYILKQFTASLTNPNTAIGKKYWQKVEEVVRRLSKSKINLATFNKIWIVPDTAKICESVNPKTVGAGLPEEILGTGAPARNNARIIAFVKEAKLKVMLEDDYFAIQNNHSHKSEYAFMKRTAVGAGLAPARNNARLINQETKAIFKREILPLIEKEVNTGEIFAPLRQMYYALILALYFKKKFKNVGAYQPYIDKEKISLIGHNKAYIKDMVYNAYIKAFKQGNYNFTKREFNPYLKKEISQRYLSGGLDQRKIKIEIDPADNKQPPNFAGDIETKKVVLEPIALEPKSSQSWELDAGTNIEKISLIPPGANLNFLKDRLLLDMRSKNSDIVSLDFRQFMAANLSTQPLIFKLLRRFIDTKTIDKFIYDQRIFILAFSCLHIALTLIVSQILLASGNIFLAGISIIIGIYFIKIMPLLKKTYNYFLIYALWRDREFLEQFKKKTPIQWGQDLVYFKELFNKLLESSFLGKNGLAVLFLPAESFSYLTERIFSKDPSFGCNQRSFLIELSGRVLKNFRQNKWTQALSVLEKALDFPESDYKLRILTLKIIHDYISLDFTALDAESVETLNIKLEKLIKIELEKKNSKEIYQEEIITQGTKIIANFQKRFSELGFVTNVLDKSKLKLLSEIYKTAKSDKFKGKPVVAKEVTKTQIQLKVIKESNLSQENIIYLEKLFKETDILDNSANILFQEKLDFSKGIEIGDILSKNKKVIIVSCTLNSGRSVDIALYLYYPQLMQKSEQEKDRHEALILKTACENDLVAQSLLPKFAVELEFAGRYVYTAEFIKGYAYDRIRAVLESICGIEALGGQFLPDNAGIYEDTAKEQKEKAIAKLISSGLITKKKAEEMNIKKLRDYAKNLLIKLDTKAISTYFKLYSTLKDRITISDLRAGNLILTQENDNWGFKAIDFEDWILVKDLPSRMLGQFEVFNEEEDGRTSVFIKSYLIRGWYWSRLIDKTDFFDALVEGFSTLEEGYAFLKQAKQDFEKENSTYFNRVLRIPEHIEKYLQEVKLREEGMLNMLFSFGIIANNSENLQDKTKASKGGLDFSSAGFSLDKDTNSKSILPEENIINDPAMAVGNFDGFNFRVVNSYKLKPKAVATIFNN